MTQLVRHRLQRLVRCEGSYCGAADIGGRDPMADAAMHLSNLQVERKSCDYADGIDCRSTQHCNLST